MLAWHFVSTCVSVDGDGQPDDHGGAAQQLVVDHCDVLSEISKKSTFTGCRALITSNNNP